MESPYYLTYLLPTSQLLIFYGTTGTKDGLLLSHRFTHHFYTGNIRQAYLVLKPANAKFQQDESKELIANYESSLTVLYIVCTPYTRRFSTSRAARQAFWPKTWLTTKPTSA